MLSNSINYRFGCSPKTNTLGYERAANRTTSTIAAPAVASLAHAHGGGGGSFKHPFNSKVSAMKVSTPTFGMPLAWLTLVIASVVGILILSHHPADAQTTPTISVTCPSRVAALPSDAGAPGSVACTFAVSPQPTGALTIQYEVAATGNRGLSYQQNVVTTATTEQDHIYYLPDTTSITVSLMADAAYTVGSPSEATIAVGTSTAYSGVGLHVNESGALDGYTLLTSAFHNRFYLIDNEGRQAYQWDHPGALGKLLDTGNLLVGHTRNHVSEINADDTYAYNYPDSGYHHDVVKLSNGNFLYIDSDYYTVEEAVAAGANPACLDENGLEVDSIIEIQPSGTDDGTVVWQWNVWDHLIQDHDSTKDNYGTIADHPELIDINYGLCQVHAGSNPFLKNPHHLTHLNSIDYNATLNQILITSRHFSEAWVIDHSTTTTQAATNSGGNSGVGGNLLYRFGNPRTHQHGNKGDQKLFFPHNAYWIASGLPGAGNIMIYNNGHEHPGFMRNYASVDELAFPSSGHTYLRAGNRFMLPTLVWTHRLADPTWIMSNAQRLPNGNTLITEGNHARISEVTKDGSVVWHYISPLARSIETLPEGGSPSDPSDTWTYRAYKYASNHPGISALTLTPTAERKLLTAPGVSIEAGPEVTEGATATFTLTVSPLPSAAITVNVSISQVGDFATAATTTVTIPTTGTATLSVDTIGDTTDEPNGSVSATIASSADYRIASNPTATVDVIDDDDPLPVVDITASGDITEGANAVFTLTANPAPAAALTVTVAITTTGDYGITTGNQTVTINTNGTGTLTIPTTNDTTNEPNGSVSATIASSADYRITTNTTATIDIADDDIPVVSIAASGDITEGANAVFTLTANPAPATALTVTVAITTTGDYGITPGNQTVTINTNGTGTLTIPTTNDTTNEPNGTITATLTDNTTYDLDSTNTTATIDIADNDDPPPPPPDEPVVIEPVVIKPVVTLKKATAIITERTVFTGRGTTSYTYDYYLARIDLDKPVDYEVSVYFTFQNTGSGAGHATVNEDFMDPSRRIYINPGWTRATAIIRIVDDTDKEPDETLQLMISDAQGATIDNNQTILTIQDND